MTAQDQQSHAPAEQWKCGNEFLPYHPSASHVEPAYRDGWNACFKAAAQVQAMLAHCGVGNEEKPAQTRMGAGSSPGPELPSGWQVVPVEPTAEMLQANGDDGSPILQSDAFWFPTSADARSFGRQVYGAMLAAAPRPPAAQEHKPLTYEQIREWWASENGLEDCDLGKLVDFTTVVREVETKLGIK